MAASFIFARRTASTLTCSSRVFTNPRCSRRCDAEGTETDVLRGFGRHLSDPALPAIVFETSNDFLVTHGPADLHALLAGAGFSSRALGRHERTAPGFSNFLATRA